MPSYLAHFQIHVDLFLGSQYCPTYQSLVAMFKQLKKKRGEWIYNYTKIKGLIFLKSKKKQLKLFNVLSNPIDLKYYRFNI